MPPRVASSPSRARSRGRSRVRSNSANERTKSFEELWDYQQKVTKLRKQVQQNYPKKRVDHLVGEVQVLRRDAAARGAAAVPGGASGAAPFFASCSDLTTTRTVHSLSRVPSKENTMSRSPSKDSHVLLWPDPNNPALLHALEQANSAPALDKVSRV